MKKILLLVLVVMLASCVARRPAPPTELPINIYNLGNGDMFTAIYNIRSGELRAVLPSGVSCVGEALTIDNSVSGVTSTWGEIYSWGYTGSTTGSYKIHKGSAAGTAVLRCEDKNVVQCEYIANRNNRGSGFCKDNKNNKYKVMF